MKTSATFCVVCILAATSVQADGTLQEVLQAAEGFNALFLNGARNTGLLDGGVTIDISTPVTVAAPEIADLEAGVVTDGAETAAAPNVSITEVSTGVTGVVQTGSVDVGVQQGPLLVSPALLPASGPTLTGGLDTVPGSLGQTSATAGAMAASSTSTNTSEPPAPLVVQTTGPLILSNSSQNTGNVYGGVSVSGRINSVEMDEVSTNAVGVQSAGSISIMINNN